jgi:putative phosphoesterase
VSERYGLRMAVFSDVHANIHALNAVLDDIDQRDVDLIVCLGDLVGYGAFPNEVIETIRKRGIPTIRGNYDDGIGFEKSECGCAYKTPDEENRGQRSFNWTAARVTDRNKQYLASLLDSMTLEVFGKTLWFVHGSPRRINEYLFEDRPESSLKHALGDRRVDALLCGHTHLPYDRVADGVHFINTGSAGKPKDGDARAAYALVTVTEQGILTESPRVAYGVAAAAAAIRATDLPHYFAEALEQAKG